MARAHQCAGSRRSKKPASSLPQGRQTLVGVLAQLVERLVRNEKVRGSNPLGSTNSQIPNPPLVREGAFGDSRKEFHVARL